MALPEFFLAHVPVPALSVAALASACVVLQDASLRSLQSHLAACRSKQFIAVSHYPLS